jgi:hypothetical protein
MDDVPVELPRLPITPAPHPTVQVVPVEDQHTERAFVAPNRDPMSLSAAKPAS